ncbi:hypothetical protein BFL36_12965 [Clavibacter michiganensis]|uniref:Integral membrane protein n=2 Tax=Clavibacter TaxID=1573 RepID=A0A251Y3U3_9MICO|nr:hypothetical protein [Clavibacter michiganensis]OQJ62376.1 hypothetical protein B5P24_04815 [Clavibacter michiganensis subsp. tessellarius]OUE18947.1 hypothetical protein BFL36_12965 [Clavibacter michiganensis]UKF34628.1 hypothetical protein FGG90_11905 [Clavibacter michiganensis subsp. tessellarius]
MDDRRSFEHDSAAKRRLTGELSARQSLGLVAVTAFMSASALAFVELDFVMRIVVMVVVMLVLAPIGRVVIRRSNLRRNR